MDHPTFPAESSNTLFHFTSRDNLLGILENNFQPRWRLEDLSCMIPSEDARTNPEGYIYAFPMVCFCDIPLSRIGRHMSFYKRCGIGLTKDWGRKKGLNPVLYVHGESKLARDIFRSNQRLAGEAMKLDALENEEEWTAAMREHSMNVLPFITINDFIKPYNDSDKENSVRFYDEREWRYVPECKDPAMAFRMFKKEFDAVSPEALNELNSSMPLLEFEPPDIRYIIVETDDDVHPMYTEVMKIKSETKKYTKEQLELLATRIISSERIREDF